MTNLRTGLSIAALFGGVAMLASCVDAQNETPPDDAAPPAAETIDSFSLVIEAERWFVIVDNAMGASIDLPSPETSDNDDDLVRIHSALRDGALALGLLRNTVCAKRAVEEATCAGYVVPDWALSFAPTPPSIETLQQRSNWLGENIWPFEEAGCRIARSREDDFSCAVE